MVDHGAGANAAGDGRTTLHWAAEADRVAAIDMLVEAGADVQAGGEVPPTALCTALPVRPTPELPSPA